MRETLELLVGRVGIFSGTSAVFSVPTKNHWKDPASLEMVKDAMVKLKMLPEHVKPVAFRLLGADSESSITRTYY